MSKSVKFLILALLPMLFVSFQPVQAEAETLTFRMKSVYPYKVSVVFYSEDRNHSWPGGTKVWVLSDSEVHDYKLRCNFNEKICFGAWVRGNKKRYWGVGYRQRHSCSSCCFRCKGGVTRIQTLRR